MPRPDSSDSSGGSLGPSDLPGIKEELLAVQEHLGSLLEASVDPLAERSLAEELVRTRSRRDELLDTMGRVLLRWMMDGGEIELSRGLPVRRRAPVQSTPEPTPTPTPPTPPRAEPSEPPLDAAALARLVNKGAVGPSWAQATQTEPRTGEVVLDTRLGELIEPLKVEQGRPQGDDFAVGELDLLVEALDHSRMDRWRDQEREAQRALVGLVTARARYVQDETDTSRLGPVQKEQLDRLFSVLTAYSKREQPGFVYGLQRSHRPVADSWWDDAYRWWRTLTDLVPANPHGNPEQALDALREALETGDPEVIEAAVVTCLDAGVSDDDNRLLALVTDVSKVLQRKARFKRIRKALRVMQAEDEASEADLSQTTKGPGADWPHWDQVRGRHAAIIGGDSRESARLRIEEAFELAEAEWVTTDHSRNLQTLKEAVIGGRVDLVIVLRRFIGHDVDRVVLPACKEAGVPWVSVDRGYGTTQVQQAMERFLS